MNTSYPIMNIAKKHNVPYEYALKIAEFIRKNARNILDPVLDLFIHEQQHNSEQFAFSMLFNDIYIQMHLGGVIE